MNAREFDQLEAQERQLLADHVAKVVGEAALRDLLSKIIALPRHNVFGSIVIQSGALRRLITGEVLTEAQHTPLPAGTRLYKVSYRSDGPRALIAEVIARSPAEAKAKVLQRYKTNHPKAKAPCIVENVVPMINERGFSPTKG